MQYQQIRHRTFGNKTVDTTIFEEPGRRIVFFNGERQCGLTTFLIGLANSNAFMSSDFGKTCFIVPTINHGVQIEKRLVRSIRLSIPRVWYGSEHEPEFIIMDEVTSLEDVAGMLLAYPHANFAIGTTRFGGLL